MTGKLKMDMPILTCIFFTFNWSTLTSEMHFVKFHLEVASCLLSRGKRKYAPLGMRLLWKYIRNYFLVGPIPFNFTLFVISPKLQRIWSCNFGFAIRKISCVTRGRGQELRPPPGRNSAPLLPPNEITFCTEVYGELPFWVPVSPPAHSWAPPCRHLFLKSLATPLRKIWAFIWYPKIYYFRLSPGGWECYSA